MEESRDPQVIKGFNTSAAKSETQISYINGHQELGQANEAFLKLRLTRTQHRNHQKKLQGEPGSLHFSTAEQHRGGSAICVLP